VRRIQCNTELRVVLFVICYWDENIQEFVIDGACSTHEIDEIFVEKFGRMTVKNRKLRRRGHRNQRNVVGVCWLD